MPTARDMYQQTQPRLRRSIGTQGAVVAARGLAMAEYCRVEEDFLGDAGDTPPPPWTYSETGTSGNATGDYTAAADGAFALTHSADNEAQSVRLDWGDSVQIPIDKGPVFEARLKINFAGATFSADQRAVWGLATAHNATLDSNSVHAWFRVEGASLNLLAEVDDNDAGDDDDNDTGVDIADNTYAIYEIDCSDLSRVTFRVNGEAVGAPLDLSGVAPGTLVQPYICMQKDAGTEQEVLTVDYCKVTWERS